VNTLTHEQIRAIVRESVHETFASLGLDADEWTEAQADMAYLRRLRRGAERTAWAVRAGVISILVSALLYALWEGIKQSVTFKL